MTQPSALPVDPFPQLALIYDTPIVKAFRIETGRYLTVDLDGVEIAWMSDSDAEIVAIASSIGHRVICTMPRCKVCATDLETYGADPHGFVRTSRRQPPDDAEGQRVRIPEQRESEGGAPRRGWVVAAMMAVSGIGMALTRRGR
jgi:hypothetical protein